MYVTKFARNLLYRVLYNTSSPEYIIKFKVESGNKQD